MGVYNFIKMNLCASMTHKQRLLHCVFVGRNRVPVMGIQKPFGLQLLAYSIMAIPYKSNIHSKAALNSYISACYKPVYCSTLSCCRYHYERTVLILGLFTFAFSSSTSSCLVTTTNKLNCKCHILNQIIIIQFSTVVARDITHTEVKATVNVEATM